MPNKKGNNKPFDSPVAISSMGELGVTRDAVSAMQEIQAAVLMARHFPRDDNKCWQSMEKACMRKTLAEKAQYSYPRGGSQIQGKSIYLARELGRIWGNMRYGLEIVKDEYDKITIRGWAWDLETNTKNSIEDTFGKKIYRIATGWIIPDERDLRELVMRRGAIAIRGAILSILPDDFSDDAVGIAKETLRKGIKDPEGQKKRLIREYTAIGVTVEMINRYLGKKEWLPEDLVELTGILNAVKDGIRSAGDYFQAPERTEKSKSRTDEIAKDLNVKTEPETETKTAPSEDEPETKTEKAKPKNQKPKKMNKDERSTISTLLNNKLFDSKKAKDLQKLAVDILKSKETTSEEANDIIGKLTDLPNKGEEKTGPTAPVEQPSMI